MNLKSWLWFIINYLFNYTSYNKNWIAETVEKYLIFCCEVKTLVSFRVKCLWVIWSPIELICYRVRTGKIRCVAMKMKKTQAGVQFQLSAVKGITWSGCRSCHTWGPSSPAVAAAKLLGLSWELRHFVLLGLSEAPGQDWWSHCCIMLLL